MKEFHVNRSGIRRYLYILFMLFMVGASALLVISQRSQKSVLTGVIGMLAFGVGAFVLARKAFGSSLLILTVEGFTDNSTASAPRFIPWEMVSSITIAKMIGQTFIRIPLKDTAAYLDTLPSLKKVAAEFNLAFGYTPISISLLGTAMHPQDVLSHMMEFWEASKKSDPSPSFTPPAIDNITQNG